MWQSIPTAITFFYLIFFKNFTDFVYFDK